MPPPRELLSWVEEVDLLDALAELLLVRRHLVEQLGVRDDHDPPLLRRHPDRVDVPEPAVVVELRVVVVQDVEVREPLALRHEPADGVRDLERAVAVARRSQSRCRSFLGAGAGCCGDRRRLRDGDRRRLPGGRWWCLPGGWRWRLPGGWRRRLAGLGVGVGDLLQFLADQPEQGGADPDGVPLGQRRVRDALPIDESAVTAVQVHDAAFARHVAQLGVLAGGGRVGDHDVVLRGPADAHRRGRPWPRLARLAVRLWRRPVSADGAAQHRPVSGIAEPDLAFRVDLDPLHPLAAGIGAIGAAVVRQHPAAVLQPEHGMVPGHAGIGDHDVALWIAADHIRRAGRQAPVRSLGPYEKRPGTPPKGTFRPRANSRAIQCESETVFC